MPVRRWLRLTSRVMVARTKEVAMGMEGDGWIQGMFWRFIPHDLVTGCRGKGGRRFRVDSNV